MKESCNYHPTRTAHWNCTECGAMICSECVIKREKGDYQQGDFIHLCPKCNVPVEWLGVEKIIEPFWSRLPKMFTYPFFLQPLILMGVLSVVNYLFAGPGLFSMLMRGATLLILLKYSFEVLKTTASGNLKPPKITSETISDDYQQVFKQFGIFIVIFISFGWISAKVNPIMGILFIIFAIFFVPSMIILLVSTSSLVHALNPIMFVQLTFRIGLGYFLMYFFLILLGSAPAYAGQYIKYLDKSFPVFLTRVIFSS